MRYHLISCYGYEPAVLGMMLSYGKTSYDNFEATTDDINRVALKLAPMDGGHNKFLEQIQYWILIQAPLFWWKQFDTYRVGVSKSSESTMHKSWKNGLTHDMFETPIFMETLDNINAKSLRNMYFQRKDHKLSQWREFCEWIKELPYGRLITAERECRI